MDVKITLPCATEPYTSELEAELCGRKISLTAQDQSALALVDLSAQDAVTLANWLIKAAIKLDPGAVGPGPMERVPPARIEPTPLFQLYLAYIQRGIEYQSAMRMAKVALAHIGANG